MQISRKPLAIGARFQRATSRKWHMENRMVMWLKCKMAAWRRFALSACFSYLLCHFLHVKLRNSSCDIDENISTYHSDSLPCVVLRCYSNDERPDSGEYEYASAGLLQLQLQQQRHRSNITHNVMRDSEMSFGSFDDDYDAQCYVNYPQVTSHLLSPLAYYYYYY